MARLRELNVELIAVDDSNHDPAIAVELKRSDRAALPVNLIYPPNYPEEPAIMLNEVVAPADVLKVLARMEKIQNMIKETPASSDSQQTDSQKANSPERVAAVASPINPDL